MGKGQARGRRPVLALIVVGHPADTHAHLRSALAALIDQLEIQVPDWLKSVAERERNRTTIQRVADVVLAVGPEREWWEAVLWEETLPKLRDILGEDDQREPSDESLLALQRRLVALADEVREDAASFGISGTKQAVLQTIAERLYALLEHFGGEGELAR